MTLFVTPKAFIPQWLVTVLVTLTISVTVRFGNLRAILSYRISEGYYQSPSEQRERAKEIGFDSALKFLL